MTGLPAPPQTVSWQRMVKNLEKELVLLKQELAIHDSLVRGLRQGSGVGAGWTARGARVRVPGGQRDWVDRSQMGGRAK